LGFEGKVQPPSTDGFCAKANLGIVAKEFAPVQSPTSVKFANFPGALLSSPHPQRYVHVSPPLVVFPRKKSVNSRIPEKGAK
jgi:hypothetical protein